MNDNMSKKIFSQEPQEFNLVLAEELKKIPEFEIPDWARFVKSGVGKERPPVSDDFWYIRASSILRQLYLKGIVGVGRLRTRYGSRKRRGGRPDSFRKASGKMIRIILQQAEKAGLVEKVGKGKQFGRRLTQHGRDFLSEIELSKKTEEKPEIEKRVEKVKEPEKIIEKSEVNLEKQDGIKKSKSTKQ